MVKIQISSIAIDHSYSKTVEQGPIFQNIKEGTLSDNSEGTVTQLSGEEAKDLDMSGTDLIIGENISITDDIVNKKVVLIKSRYQMIPEKNRSYFLGANKKQLTIPQTEISANGGDYMNYMNGGQTNQNRDQHDTKEDWKYPPETNGNSSTRPRTFSEDKITQKRFQTRKCLLIHDPFMKDFSPELISKWYDVMRCKTRSFKKPTSSIHVGQGDLWDKTEVDRILDYFKKSLGMYWKIPIQGCVSLSSFL